MLNVHNTAIRDTLSPSRTCGNDTACVHGCPQGVVPMKKHTESRDNPMVKHVRRNATIAHQVLGTRCLHGGPLFASWLWPRHTGCPSEAIDM